MGRLYDMSNERAMSVSNKLDSSEILQYLYMETL